MNPRPTRRAVDVAIAAIAIALLQAAFAKGATIPAGPLAISPEAADMIVEFETGGRADYERSLQRPTVPPGASGITVGIGYDLGYNTPAQIAADWTGAIPAVHVQRLQGVAGLTGAKAKAALPRVKDINIPWSAARAVYERKTVPRFAALTAATYPGITKQHPHIQGVMLSTTFNRGSSLTGDRRRELLWSRTAIAANRPTPLPGYQLQMRRLWPTIRGLQRRYGAHAGLMERALDHP